MHRYVLRAAAVAGAIIAAACVEYAPVTPTVNNATQSNTAGTPSLQMSAVNPDAKSYLINFTGASLPADLEAQVSAAGGAVTTKFGQIGVALASSTDPSFSTRAAKIRGVADVSEDIVVQWTTPERVIEAVESAVEIWVTPGPQVTEATPVLPVAL